MPAKNIDGLSDLIEHFAQPADGVILTTAGIYVASFEFLGHDMDAAGIVNANAVAARIASRMTFGSGWTIHANWVRDKHLEYCESSEWPCLVSELIDMERRKQFTDPRFGHRLSRYFLSICYDPNIHLKKKTADWLFTGDDEATGSADRDLALFESRMGEFESVLDANLLNVRRLKSFKGWVGESQEKFCEHLQFIRYCISGEDYRFRLPDRPAHLAQFLVPGEFLGGAKPELGNPRNGFIPGKGITVLSIDGFPDRSWAGILRVLDGVRADFRFSMSGELMDAVDAEKEHEANRQAWGAQSKPQTAQVTGEQVDATRIDIGALKLQADAAAAKSAATHGDEINMHFSAKLIIADSDLGRMYETVQELRLAVQRCGFQVRIEGMDAVDGWLSSLPGMHKLEIRKHPITTENFAHMMPLSTPYRGHKYNPNIKFFPPKSPPLFYATTNGGTPYRFNPYVVDVGHHLIVGPNGTGKSSLLGLEIVSFLLRYLRSQVVVFDKKRSLRTLCLALGGSWYDLNPNSGGMKLCPLQNLETPLQRNGAIQVIKLLAAEAGLTISPERASSIKSAVERVAAGRGGRSLTAFRMAVDDEEIRTALHGYLGGILDGDHDNLSLARLTMFEVDALYQLDHATVNGALFTIFWRLRERLDSSIPTLICIDEFTQSLSHEYAVSAIRELLLEARKMNGAVGFAVQETQTLMASPLRAVVLGQCATKIFLANPLATADAADMYAALGANDLDREIIAEAQPKRDYYHVSPDGKRLIDLELGCVAKTFICESSGQDADRIDVLMERYPDTWQAQWLREHDLQDWADVLEAEMSKGMYLCKAGD